MGATVTLCGDPFEVAQLIVNRVGRLLVGRPADRPPTS